jgi:hypothetical protein
VKAPKTRNGIPDVSIHGERSSFERARSLRAHLAKAQVTRARLTENTATTMHVCFRSLRNTGIRWLALAGIDVAKIQRRAGHDEISTTMGYVKGAEDIGGRYRRALSSVAVVTGLAKWARPWERIRPRIGPSAHPRKKAHENRTKTVSPAGELSNFGGCKPALFLCHVDELEPTRARRTGRG